MLPPFPQKRGRFLKYVGQILNLYYYSWMNANIICNMFQNSFLFVLYISCHSLHKLAGKNHFLETYFSPSFKVESSEAV